MELPKRKQNRLKEYDYSTAGAYFVTICTHERRNILCEIVGDGSPVPKPIGLLTQEMIEKIHEHFPSVQVDKYIIMPNHIHLLLLISQGNGTGNPSPTIGNVVAWVKCQITKGANRHYGTSGRKVFQRSYHDHIIRDEQDYREIWGYIEDNPRKWAQDRYYTE